MTQENKELLLKDLCGRLPYGVKVQVFNYGIETVETLYEIDLDGYITTIEGDELNYSYKPYLFPMSSMTEGQKKEYRKVCELDTEILSKHPMDGSPFPALYYSQDWLDKNHFDYRGLIPIGLAIDATGLNIYKMEKIDI